MNLKEALMRVPGLHARSVISQLADGPTNTSYLVRWEGENCVLRIDKPEVVQFGLSRESEAAIMEVVSQAGIGPQPLFIDLEIGVSLRAYIAGEDWSLPDMIDADRLARVAARLRDVHALAPIGDEFSPGLAARRYARQVGSIEAQKMADEANVRLAELRQMPSRECLCHNDPVAQNWIDTKDRLWLIDWEYAGIGDPWFDLAVIVTHHQLDDDLRHHFVTTYLRREPRTNETDRLYRWCRFYGVLLKLWQLRTGLEYN